MVVRAGLNVLGSRKVRQKYVYDERWY